MFGRGVTLTPDSFGEVLRRPARVGLGVVLHTPGAWPRQAPRGH